MGFDHPVFLAVLTSPVMAAAAWTTIWVATLSQMIGTAIGFAVAPLIMARARAPRAAAFFYLWVFRGTPLLAQILFFYAVLPQTGIRLSVVATGILALSVNEGARMAEVVRSGLLSVPREQREAAAALGLSGVKAFFLVVAPQAMRAILPPLGNNYSYMIKATSLLSVISFSELLRTSQQLAQSTARPLEIYAAAALCYLAIITVVTIAQKALERHLERPYAVPPRGAAQVADRTGGDEAEVRPSSVAEPAHRIVLAAKGLSKRLGATQALDRVDISVARGEVVALLGPSGSGKSTLLRCLNRLETPDAGVVEIEGDPVGFLRGADGRLRLAPERVVDRQRRRMGMVFQRFNLFAHLTALRNVSLGPERLLRETPAAASARALALLARFGLADFADRYPAELSGGQRQRVAIARALAMEPTVLLFDEPTSALDPESVGEVLNALRVLAQSGMTMVVATHEIGFAKAVATRAIIMHGGRIIEEGPATAVLTEPRTARARAFLAQKAR